MHVSAIFEGTGGYFHAGVLSGHGEKASCSLQWVVLNLIIYCGGCTISVFNQSNDNFLRKLTMLSIMWLNVAFAGFDHQFFRKHTEGYYRVACFDQRCGDNRVRSGIQPCLPQRTL
jgi:hypothetical protein